MLAFKAHPSWTAQVPQPAPAVGPWLFHLSHPWAPSIWRLTATRNQRQDEQWIPGCGDHPKLLVRVQLRRGVRAPGHASLDVQKLDVWLLLRGNLHGAHFRRPVVHAEPPSLPACGHPVRLEHGPRTVQHRRRVTDRPGALPRPEEPGLVPLHLCAQVSRPLASPWPSPSCRPAAEPQQAPPLAPRLAPLASRDVRFLWRRRARARVGPRCLSAPSPRVASLC